MTFFGVYRGPAWETGGHAAVASAAAHGVPHPADPHAHGQAHRADHEVTHGPAEPHDESGHRGAGASGLSDAHGRGAWHGPHESPSAMTYPLMALAIGAIVAGFVGVPAALGGTNTFEKFLEPSVTAERVRLKPDTTEARSIAAAANSGVGNANSGSVRLPPSREASADRRSLGGGGQPDKETTAPETGAAEPHVSRGVEIGLMGFSVMIAVIGIGLAWKFYVTSPDISERLAERWAGAHRLLLNKYYVDELYNATIVGGTMASGRGLWAVDRNIVDGAVNGTSWVTVVSSWFSGLTDRTVVDGLVNLVGWVVQEGSLLFRRLQTGLVQNYALLMLFGIFAFVSIYLFLL
jgi:NADH-quinone oxidoreductase subunit L